MDKLEEVKADIRRGRLDLSDLDWLVSEIERLSIVEQAYQALLSATAGLRK